MGFRISVDTGGTFTDVVVADETGVLHLAKAPTDLERAFQSIEDGLAQLAPAFDLTVPELLARTDVFTYGTTRATNAIVEGRTARTAFFTTEGFPDVLLLREGGKLEPFRQLPYPPPYVPRYLTFEIRERIDSEGDVFVELDEASVLDARSRRRGGSARRLSPCACSGRSSTRRTSFASASCWSGSGPESPFTLSHRLNPIIREYRRASSTAIDASLKPLMQEYLRTMEHDLRQAGLAGHIFVATSFGGAWRPQEVVERPIYSVGSGPSMAPVAALTYARAEHAEKGRDLIVCDTGGTTFDVGLVSGGEINFTAETWLGGRWIGHITGIRAVDVKSIGAGGGSIVWIDPGGLLRVGPQSAGADPGPACYGRGGTEPTITDAAVVLGWIDPDYFLGGRLPLDAAAARESVERAVAAPAGHGCPRGRLRRPDDRLREHRRRHPGDHDRAGHRPARGDDSGRRRRLRPERRADRTRARLPPRAAALDGECPLVLRRALRGHRLGVLAQPLRGDPLARPRRRERGAGGRRRPGRRVPRGPRLAAGDRDAQGLPRSRRATGHRSGSWTCPSRGGSRRTRTCAPSRRRSTPRTSGSSPCASRASTSSACSGRRGRRPCSRSRSCGRASSPAAPETAEATADAYFRETGLRARPSVRGQCPPGRRRGSRGRRSSASRPRPSSSTRDRPQS